MCQPQCYPGRRAPGSYVFLGDEITTLCGKNTKLEDLRAGDIPLDEMFPDLDKRYMIVGYGSNASPPQLRSKFSTNPKMPVLCGTLKDHDIVYAGRRTSKRYIPATITGSKGTVVEAWANVLDKDQLTTMNESEGCGYAYMLARINGSFELSSGESFSPVYTYISMTGPLLEDGQPVRLGKVHAENTVFKEKDEAEVLEYFKKTGSAGDRGEYGLEYDRIDCRGKLSTISKMCRHSNQIGS